MQDTPTSPIAEIRKGDWEWARVQYESTDRRSADIAADIGERHTTLLGRAARQKWTRDKNSRVIKETASLVLAARESESEEKRQRLEVIERVNVQMQAEVLSVHRQDIAKAKSAASVLWLELEENDESLGIQDRSIIFKRLSDTMKTLILLERQAYGIQGAIEDPEDATATKMDAAQEGMAMILAKFASVLGASGGRTSEGRSPPQTKDMGNVVELKSES